MKLRHVDLALVLLALVGGGLTWRTARQRIGLERDSARLSRILGYTPGGDESRVRASALETGDPMAFLWWLAVPKGQSQPLRFLQGDGRSGRSSVFREGLLFVRFRENGRGDLEFYIEEPHVTFTGGLGGKGLGRFLRGRWGELRVDRAGKGEAHVVRDGQPAVLLRLVMPDRMWEQARREIPDWANRRTVPVVFEVRLGREPGDRGG